MVKGLWSVLRAIWDVLYGEYSHSANRYKGQS